jgi:hypothetical protein
LHLDKSIGTLIETQGNNVYAVLFAIMFCETGLVLTPFLPGDSLLFAAGAFAGNSPAHAPAHALSSLPFHPRARARGHACMYTRAMLQAVLCVRLHLHASLRACVCMGTHACACTRASPCVCEQYGPVNPP